MPSKTVYRILDIGLASAGLIITLPIFSLLYLGGLVDTGSPLFRQQRVGRNRQPFTLYKFRTMQTTTLSIATHLVSPTQITRYGQFLRKTKLDELPQLWNVLKGDMSLVGPRPGLFNQTELTEARQKRGVFQVRPGITGLAQINAIDMSTPEYLAETDAEMLANLTIYRYFFYLVMTVWGKGQGDRVKSV